MNHPTPPGWIASAATQALADDDIHVWRILRSGLPCRTDWMTEEEQQRHSTFEHAQRREQYCRTRSSLRFLLSGYLDIPPEAVPIRTTHQGKPFVAGESLQFNLSHAGETILLAFALKRSLGIDLEYPRKLRNISLIARRVFSLREVANLESSNRPQQLFLEYWTRYEATQKCRGVGVFDNRADPECMGTLSFAIADAVACLAWSSEAGSPEIRFFDYVPTAPGRS